VAAEPGRHGHQEEGIMRSTTRCKSIVVALLASAALVMALGVTTGGATARTTAGRGPAGGSTGVKRFSLAGYVLDARYTQGRNTGNTFQQTYKASTVHGVPIAGPNVGAKFPVEDYVAIPIGNHEIYVAWLDTKTHDLLDVFVMNFRTHRIFDYAPGSLHPESIGKVTVVKTGSSKLP
jgi:hypothetical protein